MQTQLQLNLFSDGGTPSNEEEPSAEAEELAVAADLPDLAPLFERLAKSTFRSRFHLKEADRRYLHEKGMATILQHAADFVARRLAPADIPNDGHQTPMRGHPVFIAQHATGCCCRGCLSKWHHIPSGRLLTPDEQRYVVGVLKAWLQRETN